MSTQSILEDTSFGVYSSIKSPAGTATSTAYSIHDLIRHIKSGKFPEVRRYRDQHQKCVESSPDADHDVCDSLKEQIPYFQPGIGGTVRHNVATLSESRQKPLPLVMVDIDQKNGLVDLSVLKDSLKKTKSVVAFYDTPSYGLRAIVAVTPTPESTLQYKSASQTVFDSFTKKLAEKQIFGVKVDPLHDIPRLSFVSEDANAWVKDADKVVPIKYKPESAAFVITTDEDDNEPASMKMQIFNFINARYMIEVIPHDSYTQDVQPINFAIAMSVKHGKISMDHGRRLMEEWATSCGNEECSEKYHKILNDRHQNEIENNINLAANRDNVYNYGTIIRLGRKYGRVDLTDVELWAEWILAKIDYVHYRGAHAIRQVGTKAYRVLVDGDVGLSAFCRSLIQDFPQERPQNNQDYHNLNGELQRRRLIPQDVELPAKVLNWGTRTFEPITDKVQFSEKLLDPKTGEVSDKPFNVVSLEYIETPLPDVKDLNEVEVKPTPVFDSVLDYLFSGDTTQADYFKSVQGHIIFGTPQMRRDMWCSLIGNPGTGKSTVMQVVEWLLGDKAVSKQALSDYNSQFGTWALADGVRVAVSANETDYSIPRNIEEKIERITSCEGTYEVKGGRHFKLPVINFMVASNNLAYITRNTGIFRRAIILKSEAAQIPILDQKPEFEDKIRKELPNILINLWHKFQDKDLSIRIMQHKTQQKFRDLTRSEFDVLVLEFLEPANSDKPMEFKLIREEYRTRDRSFKKIGTHRFNSQLEELINELIEHNPDWEGVSVKKYTNGTKQVEGVRVKDYLYEPMLTKDLE